MSDDASAFRLHRLLEMGDMKLIFHDGRSTKVDSRKLKMASLDGILHNLVEDIVESQVVGSKRGRDDSDLPTLPVSASQHAATSVHAHTPTHAWEAIKQHIYDMDVLRLIYHGGESNYISLVHKM